MAKDLKMPALSPTMETDTLARWLVGPDTPATACRFREDIAVPAPKIGPAPDAAARLAIPYFYLTVDCNLGPLLELHGGLNANLAGRGAQLGANGLLIKAMALALQRVPDANVRFDAGTLQRFSRIDIATALAIDGGHPVPVIEDVGALSLSAITRASKSLAARARSGALAMKDCRGGAATICNLDMYGIDAMLPPVNPPRAIVLGIGAGVERPWDIDGEIALATIMAVSASFDRRAIDKAVAARFMRAFRDVVEQPLQLLD